METTNLSMGSPFPRRVTEGGQGVRQAPLLLCYVRHNTCRKGAYETMDTTTAITASDASWDEQRPSPSAAAREEVHPFRQFRDLPPEERETRRAEYRATYGHDPAIRLMMPLDGETVAHDLTRGEIRWQNSDLPAD